jgi:hypothetical protein
VPQHLQKPAPNSGVLPDCRDEVIRMARGARGYWPDVAGVPVMAVGGPQRTCTFSSFPPTTCVKRRRSIG